jgi:hypothetical protein
MKLLSFLLFAFCRLLDAAELPNIVFITTDGHEVSACSAMVTKRP